MKKVINFSNPFNGRKWLNLLEPSREFGLLFKKNLNIKKDYLGFSIHSNMFGLRGPENTKANDVICGTSFAMGSSVDIGKNWYEYDDEYKKLFNIGMPIGFIHHLNLLKEYYSGSHDRLIFLYHPNIWQINKKFYKVNQEQSDIFNSSGWTTNIFNVTYLYFKWRAKESARHLLGKKFTIKFDNKKYYINPNYSFFPVDWYQDIESVNNDFKKLSNMFKEVIVIKIPIKEEIAFKYNESQKMRALVDNYNYMWMKFKDSHDSDIKIVDFSQNFELDDYLEQDTHWSEKGNLKFHELFKINIIENNAQ